MFSSNHHTLARFLLISSCDLTVPTAGKIHDLPGKTGDRFQAMAFYFLKNIFGNGNGNGSGNNYLLPADQFRTLILHECARCDRNSHAFSLIHIDLRSSGNGTDRDRAHAVRQLSRSLVERMRTTDEIGWLDGHSEYYCILQAHSWDQRR